MHHNALLQALLTRRSVLANNMCEPGPDDEQVDLILQAAHRVPDHGKLGPWRFILFSGKARAEFGQLLKHRTQDLDAECSDKLSTFEAQRFMRAPCIIAVVSSPVGHKVPEWEQALSSGAACQNILLASQALGFSAQWLTEWYAYDEHIIGALGLLGSEKIAGFIYIGSALEAPKERVRPELSVRISQWEGGDKICSANP